MLRRRRVLVAAITGLNTIGLAVVTVRSPSSVQAVSGWATRSRWVGGAGSSAGKSDTLITSRNKPVGALIAGDMQTIAGPLQE